MSLSLPPALAKGGPWRRKVLALVARVRTWPVLGAVLVRASSAHAKLNRHRAQRGGRPGVLRVASVLVGGALRPLGEVLWYLGQALLALARRVPGLGGVVLRAELRRIAASGLFDAEYYLRNYPESASSGLEPLEDFVRHGARARRRPRALFETGYYVQVHPLLRWLRIDPLLHYLRFGRGDELDPSPLFRAMYYLDTNADAVASPLTPLAHYLTVGRERGYRAHALFDPAFYLGRYAWLERPGLDPLAHFAEFGAREGLDPHPCFDSRYYLRLYPDVAETGINPLAHYLWYGAQEQRDPGPLFDSGFYLRQYPDVAARRMNPLVHFVQYGAAQGRLPAQPAPAPWEPRSRERSALQLRPGRAKAVFVLPDGQDTPLARVLLELAAYFERERGMDCITVLAQDGPLNATFERHGLVLVEEHFSSGAAEQHSALQSIDCSDVRFALVASARCGSFLRSLHGLGVPVIALVTERLGPNTKAEAELLAQFARRVVFSSQALRHAASQVCALSEEQGCVLPLGLLHANTRGLDRGQLRRELTGREDLPADALIVLGLGERGDEDAAPDFNRIATQSMAAGAGPVFPVWVLEDEPDADDPPEGLHCVPVRADLSGYFLAADVVVSTAVREEHPSRALQALSAGRAVVAYGGRGEERSVVEEAAGRRMMVGDVAGSCQALRPLLADPAALAELGREGPRLVAERFGMDVTLAGLRALLEDQLGLELPPPRPAAGEPAAVVKPRVVFTAPTWSISGVNTFTETVMRGLLARGFDVELLFTDPNAGRDFLPDVPHHFLDEVLPGTGGPWSQDRWRRVIQYLVRASPCVFVPGYDYFASAVCAALPDEVGCLGIVHSDDFEHYEHTQRLGRYWNALVGVSERCYERMLEAAPQMRPVAHHIPYGIVLPEKRVRPARDPAQPLRIVYTGRIEQVQKNVLALPALVHELDARGLSYVLTLVGDGSMLEVLREKLAGPVDAGRVRLAGRMSAAQVQAELQASDVFLLVSFFEGLPVAMLEAMASGCVPVVSDIESGVPELVRDGVTGFRAPLHDLAAFAGHLERLADDPQLLARLSAGALEHVHARFGDQRMADAYADVLREIWREITQGVYQRPESPTPPTELGPILLPPWLQRDPATFP